MKEKMNKESVKKALKVVGAIINLSLAEWVLCKKEEELGDAIKGIMHKEVKEN